MAIKDFFWTFGEDGLDKYIDKLIEENGNELSGEAGRSVKKVADKFDRICSIFGINDFFRIAKNTDNSTSEKGNVKHRNGSYAFNKNLGCKLISLMPVSERKKLKFDLERDISQRDEVVDKICDCINVKNAGRQNTDYHKILRLINNKHLCEALEQCCFFESGKGNCDCELFRNDECVPLIINNIFEIYDRRRLTRRKLFDFEELQEMYKYFCSLILEYDSVVEYKECVRESYRRDSYVKKYGFPLDPGNSSSIRPNLFNVIYNSSNKKYLNKKIIHNILFEFYKNNATNKYEWEIYISDIFKYKIRDEKIVNLCISVLCKWYARWEAIFCRYRKYRNREYNLILKNIDEQNIERVKADILLEESMWIVTYSNIDVRIDELKMKFQSEYVEQNRRNNFNAKEALTNVCIIIINEFFDSMYDMKDKDMVNLLSEEESQMLEEWAYADVQDIGKSITIGWQLDGMSYIDSILE